MTRRRYTRRKYLGDDAYSWAVFGPDGRPVATGMGDGESLYLCDQKNGISPGAPFAHRERYKHDGLTVYWVTRGRDGQTLGYIVGSRGAWYAFTSAEYRSRRKRSLLSGWPAQETVADAAHLLGRKPSLAPKAKEYGRPKAR